MSTKTATKLDRVTSLLLSWLKIRLTSKSLEWLECKIEVITEIDSEKTLFTSFSAVPRYLGKAELNLSASELQEAEKLIPGWKPANWTVDQVGRTLFLLSCNHGDRDRYIVTIDKILAAADVGEAIAFYQSLSLLPYPEAFSMRAAEGIRTNMTSVFNAVALHNPYPAQYLNDLAWNQMVLKALFVGTPLHPIYG
ncbi:MAG: EboA domain-containing protein, partial [Cyanobacteria bacterium P01_G01_bin.19]